MVGVVLVSHSHAMALAVKELVVSMAGPNLKIAIAAGAGENHAELGTNAVEIMEAITNIMGGEGVLVLMDIGSAILSTDTALEFLDETQRARVRLSAAPFVEGALAAGVSAALGSSIDDVLREAGRALRQKEEHLGDGEGVASPAPASILERADEPAQTVRLTVPNPHGFHARPAARFVREAAAFQSRVQVWNLTRGRGPASAKSITALASLEVLCGDEIEVSATGPDATSVLRALKEFVESGLGDPLEAPAPARSPNATPSATPSGFPVPVSPGIATGPLFFKQNIDPVVPQDHVADAANEIRRLHEAIGAARSGIAREQAALRGSAGKNEAEIFEAQALLLEDPNLLECAEKSIREENENAAMAWAQAFQAVAESYARLQDEYLRQRAADVRDIGARVLAALGVARPRVGDLAEPGILVVDDLAPAEVIALPDTVRGVVLLHGGRTSHAAILLRARGVPAISGAMGALERAIPQAESNGAHVAAFDGGTGELWVDPGAAELNILRARSENQRTAEAEAARLRHEPASTADGHQIAILANLGDAGEAAAALERGAEGVGLFRTEFLFLNRTVAPGEEEQFGALRGLRERLGSRPVVVRTLDIGGDKQPPYLGLPREANPFLGERGIRLCLRRPELFQTHLRAILRAAEGGDFRILFPMITEPGELREARAALEEAHRALERSDSLHAWPVPVGIMIEVPSAVMLGDLLAMEADFFSIGTNDLTQYILAADRDNPALARFQDALHPAVLRSIRQITDQAHELGKHVAVCGEAAADPVAAGILVGLGIDELSLSPAGIPAIKSWIRGKTKVGLEKLARQALKLSSTAEVQALTGDSGPV